MGAAVNGGPEPGAGESDRAAAVVERLAILLESGATPESAWRHVATMADDDEARRPARSSRNLPWRKVAPIRRESTERRVARALRDGGTVGSVLERDEAQSWRVLGCAWSLAERSGAPLAKCLHDIAGSFRDIGEAEREVEVALTSPAATAKLVMALPLVGLGLGLLMGFDTLRVLTTNPLGIICLLSGVALLALGYVWNQKLVRRALDQQPNPGLEHDLTALAMLGGGAATTAHQQVRSALDRFGIETQQADAVTAILALSNSAGIPASRLLRSEAEQERRKARAAAARDAERLGVQLMLPLGLCVLPAFMALGVMPLIIAVLSQTLGTLA